MHTTRHIKDPQQLVAADGVHLLSAPMDVFISHTNIHLNPSYWGPDAEEFRPARWIDDSGHIITPPEGTYMPWSGGPRVCPGMKMSQVEFVGALATLFRSSRCEPLPVDGIEDPEELRQRLLHLLHDAAVKLTIQVRDPKNVQLRWVQI